MRELERPITSVFRRLRTQRFLTSLVWCWAVALALVAAVIAGEKLLNQALPGAEWIPFGVAGVVGALVAAVIAIVSGPSRLDAALAIDRAFKLNERLSTALTLPPELLETPAGRALLADTVRALKDLDMGAEFGLRVPRRAWVVLVPATASALLLFMPAWIPTLVQAKTTTTMPDIKEIAKQAQALTKKIASQRQAIDKEKFPEAEKLLAQIQKKADELAKAPPAAKDKLMVELNKLTNTLQDRQKQLGSPEQVNKQLQQLKEMGSQGPADPMAKELARGDFKKAADELQKLQEKLASGKMSEAEKKQLQEQLGEMAKKLNQAANMEERKKQLDEAKKNGGLTEEQYKRELAKLEEQKQGLKQLAQLASKLGDAQKAMQQGDMKKAAESLGMTEKQMSEMAKQMEEMQALDGAMADVQDTKSGMANDGMNQMGEGMSDFGQFGQRRTNNNGNGGRGRGAGDRAEAPDETATYTAKVKNQMVKGKAVLQGFTAATKTVKGQSVIDIQGELEAAAGTGADALTNQKIPRSLEKHVRSYYDQLNKGQ